MAIDRKQGLKVLQKELKDGSMSFLSEQPAKKILSTGIATLDSALGVGGFVRGSQVIIWGPPGAGKSALCYTTIGNMMQRDPEATACVIDIERSADPEWLVKFGIDPDRLVIVKEPTIEECVNSFQKVMRANAFDVVVIDSLGAVIRSVEFDGKDGSGGDANTSQVGGSSKVITGWVNKGNGELLSLDKLEIAGQEVLKPVIIYINQVRDKIGARVPTQDMPGGNALKHMHGMRIKVRSSGASTDKIQGTSKGKKVEVGTRVICTVERNKYAPKGRQAGYEFVWEECPEHTFGINSQLACLELAIEYGVVEAKGAWCYYGTEGEPGFVKANGKAAMLELMNDNPEFYEEVYSKTMEAINQENEEEFVDGSE